MVCNWKVWCMHNVWKFMTNNIINFKSKKTKQSIYPSSAYLSVGSQGQGSPGLTISLRESPSTLQLVSVNSFFKRTNNNRLNKKIRPWLTDLRHFSTMKFHLVVDGCITFRTEQSNGSEHQLKCKAIKQLVHLITISDNSGNHLSNQLVANIPICCIICILI